MLTKPCIFLFIPVTHPKMEYNESEDIHGGDDHDCL